MFRVDWNCVILWILKNGQNPIPKRSTFPITENAWKTIEPNFNPKRHPEPMILERREIDSLVGEGVHQGIAIEVQPLEEVFLKDILIKTQDDDKSTLQIPSATDIENEMIK